MPVGVFECTWDIRYEKGHEHVCVESPLVNLLQVSTRAIGGEEVDVRYGTYRRRGTRGRPRGYTVVCLCRHCARAGTAYCLPTVTVGLQVLLFVGRLDRLLGDDVSNGLVFPRDLPPYYRDCSKLLTTTRTTRMPALSRSQNHCPTNYNHQTHDPGNK
ncbi:hypothetical protein BJV78DRAFT_949418 [Lactifluus subvellereus]|nr:hypothetical protein BJV78DRAFT_949418 [Lactifluus subvellereus]